MTGAPPERNVRSPILAQGLEGCQLQLLLSRDGGRHPWEWTLTAALRGGVDLVQLRMKRAATAERIAFAREVVPVTDRFGVRLLINDDLDAAAALGAAVAGVHLGRGDAPVEEARRRLGERAWIGISTHSEVEIHIGEQTSATHFGLGACFSTTTKADHQLLDRGEVARACAAAHRPCFAIGGITPDNVASLVALGVVRVAVAASVVAAADPEAAAVALKAALPRIV